MSRRRFLSGFAGAGALILAGRAAQADDTSTLTATDVHVADYPTVEAVRWLGAELARETGGRLGLRQYHSGQLGRESDQVDMARHGAIDITRVYSGALNNAFPLTVALGLPYVFDSTPHLRRVIDSPIGARILAGFEARGLIGLAIYDSGARCTYTTRGPITTPADLRGMKLRVPGSDIFMQLIRALGANPTPLPYGEVFSAMQTHLIDGAENNWKSFHASRQFEVARFMAVTEHSYAPDVLLMSKRNFEQLKPDDQALLRELGRGSVRVMREHWDRAEAQAREAVEADGVQINAVDIEAFRAAAAPVRERYAADPTTAALLREIEALRG